MEYVYSWLLGVFILLSGDTTEIEKDLFNYWGRDLEKFGSEIE